MRFFCLKPLFLIIFLASYGLAQNNFTGKIDEAVTAEMRRQRVPGVSVAVIKDGELLYAKGYGLANVEHQAAVKPETVFQSGSIGKQFTAAAVMILAEENKLGLDDKLTKYFPGAPESWKDITVRHLLTHTSGMGDYPENFDMRRDYTEEDFLKMIIAQPLDFQPGEKWAYSNLGYLTLGILIGKITGKHYGDFLRERVFQPLGMTTARVISEADIVPNRASGYRLEKGELKNQRWVSPSLNTTADGALYLTALDMAKWEAGLNSEKILKRSSLEQMWTPFRLNDGKMTGYGFGWQINRTKNRRLIHHGGAWQGFQSYFIRYPDDKLAIAVFANLAQTNSVRLVRAVASAFYPELALSHAAIKDDDPELTQTIKRVLLQLSEDKTDLKLLTAEMRESYLPVKAKEAGEVLRSLSLPIAVIYMSELIERKEESGLKTSRYLLTDVGQTLVAEVKTTRDNRIAGVQITEK